MAESSSIEVQKLDEELSFEVENQGSNKRKASSRAIEVAKDRRSEDVRLDKKARTIRPVQVSQPSHSFETETKLEIATGTHKGLTEEEDVGSYIEVRHRVRSEARV
jgi:hypothetical protein